MSRFNPIRSKNPPEPQPESPPDISETQPEYKAQEITPGPSKFQVKLTFNPARNGLQLHFSDKPSDEVRAELKAAGWRWSFRNSCWYHRDTPANRDFAERFVVKLNGSDSSESQAPTTPNNIIPLPQPAASVPTWRMRLMTPLK